MDKETLTLLAQASARAAAGEMASQLRAELRTQFSEAKDEIKQDLKDTLKTDLVAYFGTMPPSEHIVQHNRVGRFFDAVDSSTRKFWGNAFQAIIVIAVVGILIFAIGPKAIGLLFAK
jgi:hypothetical protein